MILDSPRPPPEGIHMPRRTRSLAAAAIAGLVLTGSAVVPATAAAATPGWGPPTTSDRTSAAEARRVDRVPTPKLGWYDCYGIRRVRRPSGCRGTTTSPRAQDRDRPAPDQGDGPAAPDRQPLPQPRRPRRLRRRHRDAAPYFLSESCSTGSTSSASTRAASPPATTSGASRRSRTRPQCVAEHERRVPVEQGRGEGLPASSSSSAGLLDHGQAAVRRDVHRRGGPGHGRPAPGGR